MKPTVLRLYHGTDVSGIRRFDPSLQRTALGFFFSPDPITAGYYGDRLYTVEVRARNVVDFNETTDFFRVAENAFIEDPVRMQWSDDLSAWCEVETEELYDTLVEEIRDLPPTRANKRWMARLRAQLEEGESFRDYLDFYLPLVEDVLEGAPAATKTRVLTAIDERFPLRVEAAVIAWNDHYHGNQNWYMYSQNNMVEAAFAMGYDGIWMADPSPVGQPVSFVVRDAYQIKVLSETGAP